MKRNKKGRAMAGMVLGIKVGIEAGEGDGRREMEGVMVKRIKLDDEWWRVVGVYVNGDLKRKMERMRVWMEERKKGVIQLYNY